MKYKLAIPLLSFFLLIALSGFVKATTYECDSCASCNTLLGSVAVADDIVLLNQSINVSGDNCMSMSWNDDGITFDCQGFSITGDPADEGEGFFSMYVDTVDSASILNCDISNFDYAVIIDALTDCSIVNNTFHDYGTLLITDTTGCGFYDNRFTGVGWSGDYLLEFDNSESQLFWNNTFNATDYSTYVVCAGSCNQSWNESGVGNRWLLANGSGFSQTCLDMNSNGICDSPFTISSGNIDYFPIAENVGNSVVECNSYDSCNWLISQVPSYATVKLTTNITSSSLRIRMSGLNSSSSVTFDCDGHSVTATGFGNPSMSIEATSTNATVQNCYAIGSSVAYGIIINDNARYTTVKNTYMSAYYPLILQSNASYITIQDSVIDPKTDGRVRIDNSSVILFTGVTFDGSNTEEGLRFMSSSGIIIDSSTLITSSSSYNSNPLMLEPVYRNISIIVTNSTIRSDSPLVYVARSGSSYSVVGAIYDNILDSTNTSTTVYYQTDGTDYLVWNTTKTLGTNVVGGSYIGGNYYTNQSDTGFSDTCSEETGDGICDSAFSFDGQTDYLPLTLNSPTPTTIKVTIHEPQNTTYTEGQIDFNATTNATAVAICLSADGNVTYPVCSYNTSELIGFVSSVTAGYYNWTFRANNTDGNYDWEIVYFTVEETPTPTPTPSINIFFTIGKLIVGAGFLLFMIILGFMYIPDIKNQMDKIKTLAIFLIGTILGIAVIALL